jgi:outer membrane receptor protein involved in Fe transport
LVQLALRPRDETCPDWGIPLIYKKGNSPCQRLARAIPLFAATLAITHAWAAEDQNVPRPASAESPDDELSEIIVTGSRIARPDNERLQPTTILSSDFLDKRSYTNLIDALSELPAFGQPANNLVGGNQSSFGVGQSFANLYSLGSDRTLTLVDGRRFVSSNTPSAFGPTGNGGDQVDLNIIPTQLIDRVEVIGVGGAPIYGSDAVAGTINIILKHDFQGLVIDGQGGISGRGDASSYRFRALGGENFADGRGNVELNLEFAKSDSLIGTQRPRYDDDLTFIQAANPNPYQYVLANNVVVGGITVPGVPMVGDGFLGFNPNLAITNPAGQPLAFSNGHLAPYTLGTYDGTGVNSVGGQGIGLGQITTLLSSLERINATSLGHFQINDNVRVFGELWYAETHADSPVNQGAYDTALFSPAGTANGNLILSVNNPFLSAADQATILHNLQAYAAVPGNPTQTSNFYLSRLNEDVENNGTITNENTKRAVLGVDGQLPFGRDFKYEVSASYGQSQSTSTTVGINFQNFQNALNAVTSANGQIVCAPGYVNSPVPTQSKTCAPFNPFGYRIASPASVAYITSLAMATSTLTQRDLNASLTGDLFQLPGGPVKFSMGYENRRETSEFAPDQFFQDNPGYFLAIAPLGGSILSNEGFGEVLVPVIEPARDIPAVHRIELEGAAREVDNSIAGHALTWTAGFRFEPVSLLQFHGNYTRAIRAPSVTEAFLPSSPIDTMATDPCAASQINLGPDPAVRAANCAKAGITQPFTSNIETFSAPGTISGDPHLQNEVADSRTVGFDFRPTSRIRLSVDYVSIDIEQAIVTLNATNVLAACYDDPTYPNAYCSRVTRAANGQVRLVQTGYANAGYEDFNGVQTELDWSFDLPFGGAPAGLGTVDVRVNDFFLNKLDQAVGTNDETLYAGAIGFSKHRGVIDVNWSKGKVYALWQTLYTGHAIWDNALNSTNAQPGGVGTWWVHNLTLGYSPYDHLRAQLVIDNVFDRQAPYPVPASPPDSSLTIPNGIETYFSGILGRYFIASLKCKF